jgi:hypothetical protein
MENMQCSMPFVELQVTCNVLSKYIYGVFQNIHYIAFNSILRGRTAVTKCIITNKNKLMNTNEYEIYVTI